MAARVTCLCGWTGGPYSTTARARAMADKHVCRTRQRVRRGSYYRRCARCFWEGTYDTAGKADWAKRKHSCERREQAMLRAAFAEQRAALIDRTPKPCLHKIANHQHGERATYVLDRCRCLPCSEANAAAETHRERQKAYGRYHKYVSAEFVRDHLRELADYGIGLKRVSQLSGVSNGSLTKIVYGTYAPSTGPHRGRHGNGDLVRGPARRVLRKTAEAIYAVEPIPSNLNPGNPDRERTPTARLHLQALVALGWSINKLGVRLGINRGNMTPIVRGDRVMQRRTVDAVEQLYAELSMTLPPETNQRERIAASRSRRFAREHGWLPPLALDEGEEEADVPTDVDLFDEAAVLRRITGDHTVPVDRPEREEIVRRLHERGMTDPQIKDQSGLSPYHVTHARNALGLTANRYEPDVPTHLYDPRAARGRRVAEQEAS